MAEAIPKRCPQCGVEQPLAQFVPDRSKASGYASRCWDCDRAKGRAYYAANRAKKLALAKERSARRPKKVREPQACAICGVMFTPAPRSAQPRYCGSQCRRRASWIATKADAVRLELARDKASHRRRARKIGVAYEPINKRDVFERDGWRCGLCGKLVDPRLPGIHPRGATLDHIIPMNCIDLGSHTRGNVQCAHRECNTRKGRRGASQLLLIA